MKILLKKLIFCLALLPFILMAACSSSSSDSNSADLDRSTGTTPPRFTPAAADDLDDYIVNTFEDSGIDLTVTPESIYLCADDTTSNDASCTLDLDDQVSEQFSIHNGSATTYTLKFEMYGVASGFSISSDGQNTLGSWSEISIAPGETKTYYLMFTASTFGTHTSYITITTTESDHYIYLPFRARVTGVADFRVIPTGYFCSDEEAPALDDLDFLKVATGNSSTKGIKLCNSGGSNIILFSATLADDDSGLLSDAFDTENAFDNTLIDSLDYITDSDAVNPLWTKSFAGLTEVDCGAVVLDPTDSYDVSEHYNRSLSNRVIAADSYLWMDLDFTPRVNVEAGEGEACETLSVNSKLVLDTSLGTIEVPLLGATAGREPILEMTYRTFHYEDLEGTGEQSIVYDMTEAKEIDLSAESPAIIFGTSKIFADWLNEDERNIEITVTNAGTGSKNLEFYGVDLTGYFDYTEEEGVVSFPLSTEGNVGLPPGESKALYLRYHPTPGTNPDVGESSWDFGSFDFEYNAGNGPESKIALVGEQTLGTAVELTKGDRILDYANTPTDPLSLCVILSADATDGTPTTYTFTVKNHSNQYPMNVTWSIDEPTGFGYSSETAATFQIPAGQTEDIAINFTATSGVAGTVAGTLHVDTDYGVDAEEDYTGTYDRDYTVYFEGTVSDTGVCEFAGNFTEHGMINGTFIMDRITMILTDLAEPTRNLPPFRFHLPLEMDFDAGTVRIRESLPFEYSKILSPVKQMRSFLHQADNPQGCATLPLDPYRLEYQGGSYTGPGSSCNVEDMIASIDDPVLLSMQYFHEDANGDDDGTGATVRRFDPTAMCINNNVGEDAPMDDGTHRTVFYHDFVKYDTSSCQVQFYGKIATFAFNPDSGETIADVFHLSEEEPNESEAYYEGIYGSFQYDSYVTFLQDTDCGASGQEVHYPAGRYDGDPDLIKEIYQNCGSSVDSTRVGGFVDECAYFNFSVYEGVDDSTCLEDGNEDNCDGYGKIEPYLNPDDPTAPASTTKFDMTIYNGHMEAFVVNAADRSSFFSHEGHLIYSDLHITLTTKALAQSEDDPDWQNLIAPLTRSDFKQSQIILEDDNPTDIDSYWNDNKINANFANKVDYASIAEPGVNDNGTGRGNFRWLDKDAKIITPAGWPFDMDQDRMGVFVGTGAFHGKGNTSPGFTKEAQDGKGKSLYFGFHGCLSDEENPDDMRGCKPYDRDPTLDSNDSSGSTLVIDTYADEDMLVNGYFGDGIGDDQGLDCSRLNEDDAGEYMAKLIDTSEGNDLYDLDLYHRFMTCINYNIYPIDRNRYTNYDTPGDNFIFPYDDNRDGVVDGTDDVDDYSNLACGAGM